MAFATRRRSNLFLSAVAFFALICCVLQQCTSSALAAADPCNVYVDGQHGSDKNNGSSPAQALKTLAAAASLISAPAFQTESHAVVCLAEGAYTDPQTFNFTTAHHPAGLPVTLQGPEACSFSDMQSCPVITQLAVVTGPVVQPATLTLASLWARNLSIAATDNLSPKTSAVKGDNLALANVVVGGGVTAGLVSLQNSVLSGKVFQQEATSFKGVALAKYELNNVAVSQHQYFNIATNNSVKIDDCLFSSGKQVTLQAPTISLLNSNFTGNTPNTTAALSLVKPPASVSSANFTSTLTGLLFRANLATPLISYPPIQSIFSIPPQVLTFCLFSSSNINSSSISAPPLSATPYISDLFSVANNSFFDDVPQPPTPKPHSICAEGAFSAYGLFECTLCWPGSFSNSSTATNCTQCEAGSAAPEGSSQCTRCRGNKPIPSSDHSKCVANSKDDSLRRTAVIIAWAALAVILLATVSTVLICLTVRVRRRHDYSPL
ncbi:hypothetical protein QOT17_005972 [Balamuthia mandrillaris]